jgi:Na+/glutamate symporter
MKQEEMKTEYRDMLKSLTRKSHSASLTIGVVALFIISLVLLVVAIIYGFQQKNNQSGLPIFVLSLAGGVLGFFGSLLWYVLKTREYMRAESVELDLNNPGFFDYYQQYQTKIDEITTNTP